MVFTAVQFYFLILLERGVTRKTFFNPKKAGVGSIRPSPVVFPKIYFLGRGCEVFFFATFNNIISHIFPENVNEITKVV